MTTTCCHWTQSNLPTAVKAEVRTERPEATRVSVLGLKKGSLIVNDAAGTWKA